MNRAELFIEKHMGAYYLGHHNFDGGMLKDLLEKFHKECQPTNSEINKQFQYPDPYNRVLDDKAYNDRQAAFWCRDFSREEEKRGAFDEEAIKRRIKEIQEVAYVSKMEQLLLNRMRESYAKEWRSIMGDMYNHPKGKDDWRCSNCGFPVINPLSVITVDQKESFLFCDHKCMHEFVQKDKKPKKPPPLWSGEILSG